jgi:hypothetical protein
MAFLILASGAQLKSALRNDRESINWDDTEAPRPEFLSDTVIIYAHVPHLASSPQENF